MATAQTAQTRAYDTGQVVRFVRYSTLDSGADEIFSQGEMVRIIQASPSTGEYQAASLDGDRVDTVFAEEIESTESAKAETLSDFFDEVESQAQTAAEVEIVQETKPKKAKKRAAKTTEAPVVLPVTYSTDLPTGQTVEDSRKVTELLAKQDALDAAKALITQVDEAYFTLGGVLAHIYNEGIYKTISEDYSGKRGFALYTSKELNVDYRKAMYLIDIYTTFRRVGADETQLGRIGWSKAKELTRFATVDNFDLLLDAAASMTRDELIPHLRSNYVDAETGEPVEQIEQQRRQFVLTGDQIRNVDMALSAAKANMETDSDAVALDAICTEWLTLYAHSEMRLDDYLRFVESKFGVRLVPASATAQESVESREDDMVLHRAKSN